jgi:hypothetical protein
MRFGRVFALVAGGLALCIALLLLAVYVTRDEDNIQADNLLAERFTREIALAPVNNNGIVDLREVAPFEWDRVLLVQAGTPRAEISKRLGREWTGIDTVDGGDLLIFLKDDKVVRFADYRGNLLFTGFQRPFDVLPAQLRVEGPEIRAAR